MTPIFGPVTELELVTEFDFLSTTTTNLPEAHFVSFKLFIIYTTMPINNMTNIPGQNVSRASITNMFA